MLKIYKTKIEQLYNKIKSVKHLTTYIFLLGFAVDFITLPSPDNSAAYIIGIIYMLLVGLALIAREYYTRRSANVNRERYIGYSYLASAFFLGSFTSFVFIYYFRSADYLISMPIIIGLLVFVIFNELIKSRSIRLLFDTSLYFLVSFFFLIFLIPIFVGTVNNNAFIVSSIVAVLYFISFFYTLSYINRVSMKTYKREIVICISITLLVVLLFIFKILPAVPLSLKSSGVYTSIYKSGSTYIATKERKSFFGIILSNSTYTLSDEMYFYSSVHAPTSINTLISHTWEYYDTSKNSWITYSKIPFNINGGREGGYRGYTYKNNLKAGKWRVTVRNEDDRVIGRYTFKLLKTDKPMKTVEVRL